MIIPPLLAGAGILFFAIQSRKPPERTQPQELARAVRVITVQPQDVVPRISGYGSVKPGRVWNAVAQVSGKVIYVHPDLKRGALLDNNETIIRIDPADYRMAISEAEANIRSAEAKLEELKTTAENLKKILEVEKQSLEVKQGQLDRKKALLKRGSTSALAVEQEERDLLAQRRRVVDIENQLRTLPNQRSVQEAQIAINKSRLASAKLNLARTEIKTPFRGRLAEVNVQLTQFVTTGTRMAVLDSVRVAEIEAQFSLQQISQFSQALRRAAAGNGNNNGADENGNGNGFPNIADLARQSGLYTLIRLRGAGRNVQWRGELARISDTFDPQTRTVGIITTVEGSYDKAVPGVRPPLTKGMFVEVELRGRELKNRIVIPRSALHGNEVYTVNDENRLQRRKVRTGIEIGNSVSIVSGLSAGDRVVASDIRPALEGALLAPSEDKSLAQSLAKQAAGEHTP